MLSWLHSLPPGGLEKMLDQIWENPVLENTSPENASLENIPPKNKITPIPPELDSRVYAGLIRRLREQDRASAMYTRHRQTAWFMKIAASLLLIICAGIGLIKWHLQSDYTKPLAITTRLIRNQSSATERAVLPDGSLVWLTPQSSLSIRSDFAQKERWLELQGEGYFEVRSDPAHPFKVMAGGLQTTVLGTHFNIESYPGETATKVSLSEGRVIVQWHDPTGKDSVLALSPGTRVRYAPALHRIVTDRFPTDEEAAWKRGAFVMNDLPLSEALQRLATRFGKTILFRPADFRGRRFTATYEHPDCIAILDNMSYVQQFHYRIKNDSTVIIHP